MLNRDTFDIDGYVAEMSERVALIHNHPFHKHLIAILAIETKLYAEAQAVLEDEGIVISNNVSQESQHPALTVSHKAAQNILKLRKLLGLSRK